MASPFALFRKHQRVMIVVLCGLAMVAFIFLSNLPGQMGDRVAANPVVVTTSKHGKLRQSDLGAMRAQRGMVRTFLSRVQQAVVTNGGTGRTVQMMESVIGLPTERAVVDAWLLNEHAKELGVVVSDQAVNEFLRQVTEDRVKRPQLTSIIKSLGVRTKQFYELLRHELTALQIQNMFYVSLGATTPGQRWDYFKRLSQTATIEVTPVAVEAYADNVPEPEEKALLAFFEKYKDQYASPASPEPGFRKPHRVAVQFLKADYEKLMAPEEVTDEEILARYEEDKQRYDRLANAPDADTSPTDEEPAEGQTEPKTDAEPETDAESETDAEPETDATAEPDAEASPDTTPEETPAEETPAEETPADEAVEEEASQPAEESPAESETPAEDPESSDETSSTLTRSPFVLTALLQEEPAESEEETATEEEASAETESSAETEASAETESPAAESAEPEEPAAEAPAEPLEEPSADPPKVPGKKTLEEILAGPVGETIRQDVARRKATEKVSDVFSRIQQQVRKYREERIKSEAMGADEYPEPKPLDVDALAAANSLTPGSTKLFSQIDSGDYDIGGSYVDMTLPFAYYAFGRSWNTFVAEQSFDLEGNRYLFWKIEDEEESTPKFEDKGVRRQVLGAYRMVEARALTLEAAESLAEKVRDSSQTLKEALPNHEVALTAPFSWMTHGSVPLATSQAPPRLSEVTGVDLPGPEFMRTVFQLPEGQIGVAMNHPQTVAYVIRVVKLAPTAEALKDIFEADSQAGAYDTKYAPLAAGDQRQMVQAWRDSLIKSAGLKWERPAVEPQRR